MVGNMLEVKSMQVDRWCVVYTHDTMAIGCQQHPLELWRDASDLVIQNMDRMAMRWWRTWKPIIFQIIEASPAVKPQCAQ